MTPLTEESKECNYCHNTLPLHKFVRNYRYKDKIMYKGQCMNCKIATIENRRKEIGYYITRPNKKPSNKTYQNKRLKKYGITFDQYNKMLVDQSNKCKICNNESKSTLHVDHCHTTGKVRGLLCSNCNTAIGLMNDNIQNLQSAIQYLNNN